MYIYDLTARSVIARITRRATDPFTDVKVNEQYIVAVTATEVLFCNCDGREIYATSIDTLFIEWPKIPAGQQDITRGNDSQFAIGQFDDLCALVQRVHPRVVIVSIRKRRVVAEFGTCRPPEFFLKV
jgi:hypothetical protein